MLLPGHAFMPKNASESPKAINHMRAAFSVASEKDFDVAFERLAELIREEQANQKQ
jgi:DNA-binding transcriptional MocR family regulator